MQVVQDEYEFAHLTNPHIATARNPHAPDDPHDDGDHEGAPHEGAPLNIQMAELNNPVTKSAALEFQKIFVQIEAILSLPSRYRLNRLLWNTQTMLTRIQLFGQILQQLSPRWADWQKVSDAAMSDSAVDVTELLTL